MGGSDTDEKKKIETQVGFLLVVVVVIIYKLCIWDYYKTVID